MSGNSQQSRGDPPNINPEQLPTEIARATGAALAANSDMGNQGDESSDTKRDASAYQGSYRPEDARARDQAPNARAQDHDWDTAVPEQTQQRDSAPPPAYAEVLGTIEEHTEDGGTRAEVADDGRVNIHISQTGRRFSDLLAPTLQKQSSTQNDAPLPPPYIPPSLGGDAGEIPPPPMNVVIHVVGSRGDVQPFVALGKVLKETYGHRVRLATHPVFKKFVEENGLEFFSIGGDPSELMAFMVKNPGLMPGFDVLRSGDIGQRRRGIAEMIKGCWRSCIETGDGFGIEATDNNIDELLSAQRDPNRAVDSETALAAQPFIADAIIANPPSFAHIHCAEKLGIPLHMMFTMPWSPTQAFPHPLANIQSTNAEPSITNYMSYTLVDMLTWQGLGDVINRFRKDSLGLDPVSLIYAPGMLQRLKVPWTYCWSPALIPKPRDWANWISISGFYFLNLASNYTPEPDLDAFLKAGPPPVYIGFGSIVVDDPNAMTKLIFDAVRKTGQRALVSKGWGGFGVDELGIPDGVFMLGNVPHDWLFKHVSCVVHHGGAGTTAAGIASGRPTVVVPFFGDQPFWGAMVARAGAGPDPIPHKDLNADNLAAAINKCLEPQSLERAQELCDKIKAEKGCEQGAQSFHQLLKLDDLRCALAPSRIGVWRVKRTDVRLSALAATVLAQENILSFNDLKLYRPREYEPDTGPWDPITGASSALVGTVSTMMMGVADMPIETLKALRIHPDMRKPKSTKGKEPATEGSSTGQTGTPPNNDSTTSVQTDSTERPGQSLSAKRTDTSEDDAQRPGTPRGSTATSRDDPTSLLSPQTTEDSRRQSMQQTDSAASQTAPNKSSSFNFTQINADAAMGTGKGLQKIVGAGMRSPMDFSLALAQGFHNASRLYGDEPRQIEKVTSLGSGVKIAGSEFGRGVFDGITGLVRDPYKGAKKEGAAGFIKGIGKGIAGVVLKPQAGFFALPAYTFKGIYTELSKPFGASIQNYIIAARTAQGYEDMLKSSAEERADIIKRWRIVEPNLKKKKNPGKDQLDALQGLLNQHKERRRGTASRGDGATIASSTSRLGFLSPRRREGSEANIAAQSSGSSLYGASSEASGPRSSAATISTSMSLPSTRPTSVTTTSAAPHHAQTFPLDSDRDQAEVATEEEWISRATAASLADAKSPHQEQEDADLERAIAASQADHADNKRTYDEQDEAYERALQASINELKASRAAGQDDDEAMLKRAIDASLAEGSRSGMSAEEQESLAMAMRESVLDASRHSASLGRYGDGGKAKPSRVRSSDSEWDDSSADEGDFASDDEVDFEKRQPSAGGYQFSPIPDSAAGSQAQRSPSPLPEFQHPEGQKGQESGVLPADPNPPQYTPSEDPRANDDDDDLQRVLAESEKHARDEEDEKRKEQIVLEHVMKQSLIEDEARRRVAGGQKGGAEGGQSSKSGG